MWVDQIVEDIHQIREAYAKSCNDDLDTIFADLRKKEAASGKEVVDLSQRISLLVPQNEPLGSSSSTMTRRV